MYFSSDDFEREWNEEIKDALCIWGKDREDPKIIEDIKDCYQRAAFKLIYAERNWKEAVDDHNDRIILARREIDRCDRELERLRNEREAFENSIVDVLKTPEAHDKAVLAMMFKESICFDPKNETHVKGLSAILSSDRVVKPNTVNYYDYLKSPQWQTVRDAALKRANYQCEKCKSAKNLEVHHITYKRLGYELPEDLIVLCKDCHENVHSEDLKQNDDLFANSSEGFPEGF